MEQNEFVVKVAKRLDTKRYSVLKFNQADNVNVVDWTPESCVRMERADNKNVVMSTEVVQEFGEGTEYGKAAREEARRKKYGRQSRHYHLDHQPWHLSFKGAEGRERKMKSIREGDGYVDTWIFVKEGSSLVAYKVDETHRFLPAITHKTLDIDEAEEKFLERDKVMNQFALKAQIMQMKNAEEEGEQVEAKTRTLKIKDGYSSDDSDGDGDDGEEAGSSKKKKKKPTKARKDKRQRVQNADEVAKYESSDGEDEGREYDYMSDSGSDSDREEVKADEKTDKELVGVGDETGLKKMMNSDESSSDEEDLTKKLLNRKDDKDKNKDNADIEERDSSGSDSDDPDKEKINSVMFLPKKDALPDSSSQGKKRPGTSGDGPSEVKRARVENNVPEGLNVETVKKYLQRKPHTTKELISKIKSKCGSMDKSMIVTKLAAILKEIDPMQFKQKQGKKEVLFFSLSNTVD